MQLPQYIIAVKPLELEELRPLGTSDVQRGRHISCCIKHVCETNYEALQHPCVITIGMYAYIYIHICILYIYIHVCIYIRIYTVIRIYI